MPRYDGFLGQEERYLLQLGENEYRRKVSPPIPHPWKPPSRKPIPPGWLEDWNEKVVRIRERHWNALPGNVRERMDKEKFHPNPAAFIECVECKELFFPDELKDGLCWNCGQTTKPAAAD